METATVYRIGVSGEVARTATATRRRRVITSEGPRLLEFGKVPVFLPLLPPEIAQDRHLIVTPMDEGVMRQLGGRITRLSPAEPPADDHIPDDQVIGAQPELIAAEPPNPKPGRKPRR